MAESQPQSNSADAINPVPILGVAVALGLLFDFLLYGHSFGVGYSLFVLAIVLGTLVVSKRYGKPLSKTAWWCAGLSVLFAGVVSIRASYELMFMNIALSLALLLFLVSEMIGNRIRRFAIEKYATLAWLPLYFFGNVGPLFGAWLKRRSTGEHQKLGSVVRGILLALPLLAVFVLLFSSADLVFQKYVKAIIQIDISAEVVTRILLVAVVTLLFSGAYWFILMHRPKNQINATAPQKSGIGRTETRILLGSINVVFLLFIAVQFAYLFGGQQHIADQGFTYAEYARRGFFELIAVAVIAWLIVWTVDKTLSASDAGVQRTSKYLSMALIAQVFVIMASAFMRLALYEQAYGFTTLRFYSHAFVIWLAVAFMLLAYKLLVSRREDALAFSMLVSVVAFAVAVNISNPDAFIARQNMERYTASGKIDALYLNELSSDAVPEVLPLLDAKDAAAAKTVANRLYWKLDRLDRPRSRWQAFNLGRGRAKRLLESKRAMLEENKDFTPAYDTSQSQSTMSD